MSETSNAALSRSVDTRCGPSHALRSCSRSIPAHEAWNQEFEVDVPANVRLVSGSVLDRTWLRRPFDDIRGMFGLSTTNGPRRSRWSWTCQQTHVPSQMRADQGTLSPRPQ